MAVVKCPTNMTSITLATSGVLAPDSDGNITCTVAEANVLCYPPSDPKIHSTNINGSSTKGWFPGMGGTLTGFTVSGVALTLGADEVTTGFTGSQRLTPVVQQGFTLVTG